MHWDRIYRTRSEDELSWHQNEPSLSLTLIRRHAPLGSRILDIGGGSSVLAGRLIEAGYAQVAVLDVSSQSEVRARARIGPNAQRIRWLSGDVTKRRSLGEFDVWHDRAAFHFLTRAPDRERYLALARRTIPMGGVLILATFAPDGPEKCSGLPVARYDGLGLAQVVGHPFVLLESVRELHTTPWGAIQPFTYSVFRRSEWGSSGRLVGSTRTGPRANILSSEDSSSLRDP